MLESSCKQYHPNLPTVEKAKENYSDVLSDHTLIASTDLPVVIASWNVMDEDKFSGYAESGQTSFGETETQKEERHNKIAETIGKTAENNQFDFIALQEVKAERKTCQLFICKLAQEEGHEELKKNFSVKTIQDESDFTIKIPSLVRHGNKISMYGFFENRWRVIDLDSEKFKNIIFDEDKIISSIDLDELALTELTVKKAHNLIDNKEILLDRIMKKLGNKYSLVKIKDTIFSNQGNIIIYNTQKFKLNPEKMQNIESLKQDNPFPAISAYFIEKIEKNPKEIKISCAHPGYKDDHESIEEGIKKSLTEENIDINIIAGDWNHGIAPTNNDPQNITTCVSNTTFKYSENGNIKNEEKLQQGSSPIDGIFYCNENKEYKQAKIKSVNYKTGKIYETIENISSEDPEQQKEIARFHMLLTVDVYYDKEYKLFYEKTVFEYQEFLRKLLNDGNLLVRPAKTISNVAGVAIQVKVEILKSIQSLINQKKIDFQYDTETSILFISKNDITKLNRIFLEYLIKEKVTDDQIDFILACIDPETRSKNFINLQEKVKIDGLNIGGKFLIHLLCEFGNAENIKSFLKNAKKTDLEIKDEFQKTPFYYACNNINCDDVIVKFFIQKGITTQIKFDQQTPLHWLILNPSISKIAIQNWINQIKIEKNPSSFIYTSIYSKFDINSEVDNHGKTILHFAFEQGNKQSNDKIHVLLHNDCDINCKDNLGNTPFHYACSNKNISYKTFEIMLANNINLWLENNQGITAFEYAIGTHDSKIINLLLRKEINLSNLTSKEKSFLSILIDNKKDNFVTEKEQRTILHLYCTNKFSSETSKIIGIQQIDILLNNGAKLDSQDIYGKTPFHYAAENGDIELIGLLLTYAKKQDFINVVDENGMTALDYYLKNTLIEPTLVEQFKNNGANKILIHSAYSEIIDDSFYKNINDFIISNKSVEKNDMEILKNAWLLSKKDINTIFNDCEINKIRMNFLENTEINDQDSSGNTLLHYICLNANYFEKNINYLLSVKYANPMLKNKAGITAFEYALNSNKRVVIELLLKNSVVQKNLKSKKNNFIYIAIKNQQDDIFLLLLDYVSKDLILNEDFLNYFYSCVLENKTAILEKFKTGKFNFYKRILDYSGNKLLNETFKNIDRLLVLKKLIDLGFDIYSNCKNNKGEDSIFLLEFISCLLGDDKNIKKIDESYKVCILNYLCSCSSTVLKDEEILENNTAIIKEKNDFVSMGEIKKVEFWLDKISDINTKDEYAKVPLHYACENKINGFNIIQLLLQKGANPNINSSYYSPLALLVLNKNSDPKSFSLLLENNADINHKDNEGKAILHLACEYLDFTTQHGKEIFKILTLKNLDPIIKDDQGNTAFHCLLKNKNIDDSIVVDLFNMLKKTNIKYEFSVLNEKNNNKDTPFLLACQYNIDMAYNLFQKYKDNLTYSNDQKTVFHYLCDSKKGNIEIIEKQNNNFLKKPNLNSVNNEKVLVFIKDLLDLSFKKFDINTKDANGKTALIYLAENSEENIPLITFLIENSDFSIKDNKGNSFLSLLCANKKDDTLQLFHQFCAKESGSLLHVVCAMKDLDVISLCYLLAKDFYFKDSYKMPYKTKDSKTAFHYFCQHKDINIECLNLFFDKSAGPNALDANYKTPFHYFCENEKITLDMLIPFLTNGANPNLQDNGYNSPFHYACKNKYINFNCLELLLLNKANPNCFNGAKFYSDSTPFHYACLNVKYKGDMELLKLFFRFNANSNLRIAQDKTILHHACSSETPKKEYILILLQNGANPNIQDKGWKKARDYCYSNNDDILVKKEDVSNIQENDADVFQLLQIYEKKHGFLSYLTNSKYTVFANSNDNNKLTNDNDKDPENDTKPSNDFRG